MAYIIECDGVRYPIKESAIRKYFPKEREASARGYPPRRRLIQ